MSFKLGILGSGRGSNFVAIADAIAADRLHAEVAVVISDFSDATILSHARTRGIPAMHMPPGKFRTKMEESAEQEVARLLHKHAVDLVVLAGFMRMIKAPLLEAFPRRIVNIHPSLLPKFPGLESWRQALEAGEKVTGCTVHYVDSGMDTGTILAQAEVPVLAEDTAESLHARIQIAEHRLYPEVLEGLTRR